MRPGRVDNGLRNAGSVTTLLRDTQAHEFSTVFRFPVDADPRSDIFTSQTVTTLLRSTKGVYVTAQAYEIFAMSLRSLIHLEDVGIAQVLGVHSALNTYAAEVAVARATESDVAEMQHFDLALDDGAVVQEVFTTSVVPESLRVRVQTRAFRVEATVSDA